MVPKSHKTIFVLDHTPYFSIPCERYFDFDFLKRGLATKISKSLWTCSVEASIEYCRIVWDLFGQDKLVRFIVSDTVAQILNTWSVHQQNLTHIMNAFGMVGVPARAATPGVDCSVIHGLRAAIDSLCEYTDIQRDLNNESTDTSGSKSVENSCRIICITSARDNASIKRLEEIFLTCLVQQNNNVSENDDLLTITHCHFVILNIFPCNIESQVTSHVATDLTPILKVEVHSIDARKLHSQLTHLIQLHYGLSSTIITGIPMKEEQNANSSANYDVEIFHLSSTHNLMDYDDITQIRTRKPGSQYDSITLKWCTPRGSTSFDFQNCVAANRITPVDVNSRPSTCLINFLLNGRCVMLEMPQKHLGKSVSHHLSSHGGEIYIHSISSARSVIEDPPSISEGVGGRVADYRIADFSSFIQNHRLVSVKNAHSNPIEKIRSQFERYTKYWPLTISSTILYNVKNHVEPLLTLMVKDNLSENEVSQCKHVIHNVINLESKNEPLNIPHIYRIKYQKREEQYKILWTELETFIKNNLHSENHRSVYNSLLETHKYSIQSPDRSTSAIKSDDDNNVAQITPIGGGTNTTTTSNEPSNRVSVIRATTDSPLSPPTPLNSISTKTAKSNMSALDIFLAQRKVVERPAFFGRQGDSKFYKLYANLNIDDNSNAKENGMVID